MDEAPANFQGVTPEDYLEEAKRLERAASAAPSRKGGGTNAYHGRSRLLRYWYEWAAKHNLELLSYWEQTKLYVDASLEAERRISVPPSPEPDALTEDEKLRLLFDMGEKREERTLDVLDERGYVAYPFRLHCSVDPETLEVVPQRFFEPHYNVPMEARAVFKRAKKSKSTWRHFFNQAVEWLQEEPTEELIHIYSMLPSQVVDRASRGSKAWDLMDDAPPKFTDLRTQHVVEYYRDDLTLAAMREAVLGLNPRTADVWRLITAKSLEAWREGQDEPPFVWIDVRELLEVMGYAKHHKGGYKPEHLEEAARAVRDLSSFHITIPLGAKIVTQRDPKTGKRRRGRTEATRTYEVILKSATDEIKNLFGERYAMRWRLRPGEWAKNYPRQFAPLYRALVELPAKQGKYTWAKALGTELTYHYREGRSPVPHKTLKVVTLLERACLLQEAHEMKNKKRVRDYFESAMETLQEIGVCKSWVYNAQDIDQVEAVSRGWFEVWLETRVNITAPLSRDESLPPATKL